MKAFISSRMPEEWLQKLQERFEVDHYNWFEDGMLGNAVFGKRMEDCQLVVVETEEIDGDMIRGSRDLFAIVNFKSSVVNIDVETATEQGVVVFNTPGRNADAVADLAVGLMIMSARDVARGIDTTRKGLWKKNGRRWAYTEHQGFELNRKVVGLIGLGFIGKLVVKRLKGFDVKIIAYDPYVSPEVAEDLGITLVEWDEIFEQSDLISLHIPLSKETQGMIGEREFKLMKSTAHFINTARAGVVVEEDLIRCLTEKWIAGAALDVFHTEPIDADYPLLDLPHVICTPHLGGASVDVVNHMTEIGLEALFNFMDGGTPKNIVNPQAISAALEKLANSRK